MAKITGKQPTDANKRAKNILDIATTEQPEREKNAAAVALGSMGGKARAKSLSPEKRKAIAKKAAKKRWAKKKD